MKDKIHITKLPLYYNIPKRLRSDFIPASLYSRCYISFDDNKDFLKNKLNLKKIFMITLLLNPLVLWEIFEDKGFWIIVKDLTQDEILLFHKYDYETRFVLFKKFLDYINNYKNPKELRKNPFYDYHIKNQDLYNSFCKDNSNVSKVFILPRQENIFGDIKK